MENHCSQISAALVHAVTWSHACSFRGRCGGLEAGHVLNGGLRLILYTPHGPLMHAFTASHHCYGLPCAALPLGCSFPIAHTSTGGVTWQSPTMAWPC